MAMFVAQAAPATPRDGMENEKLRMENEGVPKIKSGSSTILTPKPTTMQSIERIAPPSARWSAERPNAR